MVDQELRLRKQLSLTAKALQPQLHQQEMVLHLQVGAMVER
jgi:hypothetical protein